MSEQQQQQQHSTVCMDDPSIPTTTMTTALEAEVEGAVQQNPHHGSTHRDGSWQVQQEEVEGEANGGSSDNNSNAAAAAALTIASEPSSTPLTVPAAVSTPPLRPSSQHETTATDDGVAGGAVRFGPVHVHHHRMTLGTNPSATDGVPVELAWEHEQSDLYETPDAFEEHVRDDAIHRHPYRYRSGQDPHSTVHRIAPASRLHIAEQHHSRNSILAVERDIERNRRQLQNSSKKKKKKGWGLLASLFHNSKET
jgi:hypothetical protein